MIPAKYTIMLTDLKDDNNINEVLNTYPIYDENYRSILNTKILNHYAYEEIGFETPFLFAHYLKCRLDEIMPKYNMLYKSEILKLDPLASFNIKETKEKESNNIYNDEQNTKIDSKDVNTTSNTHNANTTITEESTNATTEDSNGTNNNNETEKHVFQNTPQGELVSQNIDDYNYASSHNFDSNINEGTNTNHKTSSSTNNTENSNVLTENSNQSTNNSNLQNNSFTDESTNINTENYIKNITGNKSISTTTLYNEFIKNFIDIDSLIIKDLQDLFMVIL